MMIYMYIFLYTFLFIEFFNTFTWNLTKWLEKNLYKDAECYFEQILEAASYKTAAVRPLTSHLTNHPSEVSKICWALLKIQGWFSPRYRYSDVGWQAKLMLISVVWTLGAILRTYQVQYLIGWMTRKSKTNLSCWHGLMMLLLNKSGV